MQNPTQAVIGKAVLSRHGRTGFIEKIGIMDGTPFVRWSGNSVSTIAKWEDIEFINESSGALSKKSSGNLIEISPDVFVGGWDEVQCGYMHKATWPRIFVIKLQDGHTINVQEKSIDQTLQVWQSANQSRLQVDSRIPLQTEPVDSTGESPPPDIACWLGIASAYGVGKRAIYQH